jgi:hypothetical protein
MGFQLVHRMGRGWRAKGAKAGRNAGRGRAATKQGWRRWSQRQKANHGGHGENQTTEGTEDTEKTKHNAREPRRNGDGGCDLAGNSLRWRHGDLGPRRRFQAAIVQGRQECRPRQGRNQTGVAALVSAAKGKPRRTRRKPNHRGHRGHGENKTQRERAATKRGRRLWSCWQLAAVAAWRSWPAEKISGGNSPRPTGMPAAAGPQPNRGGGAGLSGKRQTTEDTEKKNHRGHRGHGENKTQRERAATKRGRRLWSCWQLAAVAAWRSWPAEKISGGSSTGDGGRGDPRRGRGGFRSSQQGFAIR